MATGKVTVKELRQRINEGECSDPLIFLESVMNGQDPRRISDVYELVMEIDAMTGGDLSPSDWFELVELVSDKMRYQVVTLAESHSAAKTLAEYLHPKRKQVEKMDGYNGTGSLENNPLTEEEIELFKEKFNDEF